MSFLHQELSDILRRKTGIVLRPGKQSLIENRIEALCRRQNISSATQLVSRCSEPFFLQELINTITINESLWFRDQHPFDFVVGRLKGSSTPWQVWSAACSAGQEPYSLAMAAQE